MKKWILELSILLIPIQAYSLENDSPVENRIVHNHGIIAVQESERGLSVTENMMARLLGHLQNQDERLTRLERDNQDLREENMTFRAALSSIARKERDVCESDELTKRQVIMDEETKELNDLRDKMKTAFNQLPSHCHARYRLILRKIDIPSIADGYENVYENLLRMKLTYKNDKSKISIPLPRLNDLLEGDFDLSSCGDASKFMNMSMGPRKSGSVKDTSKLEAWIMPRFRLHQQRDNNRFFTAILDQWPQEDDFAIFFNLSDWDDGVFYFRTFSYSVTEISLRDLYNKSKGFHIGSLNSWFSILHQPGSLFLNKGKYPVFMEDIPTSYTISESVPTIECSMSIGKGRVHFEGPTESYTTVETEVQYSWSERQCMLQRANQKSAPFFFSGVFYLSF